MTRYKTLDTVVLGFIDGREQVDALLDPGSVLESDGSTIWLIGPGACKVESITTANLIPVMLERGIIAEIAS